MGNIVCPPVKLHENSVNAALVEQLAGPAEHSRFMSLNIDFEKVNSVNRARMLRLLRTDCLKSSQGIIVIVNEFSRALIPSPTPAS